MKKMLAFFMIMLVCTLQCAMPCFAVERPKQEDVPTAESLYVDTGNAEADKIMNNFIDKAMVLPEKEYYNTGLANLVRSAHSLLNADFQRNCGADEEQFNRLSNDNDLEIYLWMDCYIYPCRWAMDEPERFSSWETLYLSVWNQNKIHGCDLNYFMDEAEKADNKELIDAYNAVLRYQFDYFQENGTIYCFFTGQPWKVGKPNDYSAYWGGTIDTSDVTTMYIPSGYLDDTTPTVAATTISDADAQQTTEITDAEITTPTTTTAKDSVGSVVAKKLVSTWFTLGIILVLLIAIGVIAIIKKRKGI